ncbi:MAG: GAF domain-containing protein [Chloroflexi bacterium]|nr:GAF domain-containing protein [Chloroflexota bacterium]
MFDGVSSWRSEYPGSHPSNVDNPVRTVIGVPLIWGDIVVAVLFVHSLSPNAYSPSELRLSDRIAAQIAGPVAGSILRKNETALSEEREFLSTIGTHMGAATDLSESWPKFANLLNGAIEADMVALIGIDDDLETASVMIEHHLSENDTAEDFTGSKYNLAGTLTGAVYESRRSLISNKATTAELLEQFPGAKQTVTRLRYHSTLATPLTWGGRVVAVLFINHREVGKYDSNDQELLEHVADQIDGPVAGSILREAEVALANERNILANIGVLMTSGQPISEVFSQVAEQAQNLVEFDRIHLSKVDSKEQTIQHIATWSGSKWKPGYSTELVNVPLSGTLTARVIDQKAGLIYSYIDPAQMDLDFPRTPQRNTKIPARTTVAVPLVWGDEIVAVLWMSRLGELPYTDEVLAVTERIATQISGPVAGSLLRERESALERERTMLAKISEYVGAAESFSAVFDDFVQDVAEFIHFDAVEFVEVDHIRNVVQRPLMHYRDGIAKYYETASSEFPLPGTMTEQVVNTSKSALLNHSSMAELQETFPGAPTVDHDNYSRSSFMVPIRSSDQVEACLWFSRNDGIHYATHDIEFVERIAAQIAGPVAGALIRERAALLARERATLASISELMIGATDIGSVFSEFLDKMSQLLLFDALAFMEIDHAGQTVERRHVFLDPKVDHLYQFQPRPFPLAGTIAQKVATTSLGVLNRADAHTTTEFRSKQPTPYIPRSSIMVPLLWGDEVVMTLWVARDSEKMFEEEDFALMERVASQIAGPVAGSIINRRELDIEEERRRRVIAELKVTTLSELSETKSNFVSAMSHELRTPLTSIVAFSDILSRNPKSELADRDIKQIKVIQRNARRLEEMIDELLDLSRMESGKFEIFRSSFDFVSMIEDCLESAEPQFEALSQTIHCEMLDEVLPVNGDRGRLQQVVNNLLNNASKFSPEGTDIDLIVTEKNDWLTVAVHDNGPGIQGEDSIKLFEMFHRADNEETRRVPGTGIGLHISKRIVEEHGGEIDINTRENGLGAVASFRIPTVINIIS